MIKVIKIKPQIIEHFNPNKESLGYLNYWEHLYLLVEIKKIGIYGYYLKYNNRNIDIDKFGTLSEYPKGLYDLDLNYLMELL